MNIKKSIPAAAAPSFPLSLPFNWFIFKIVQGASIIFQEVQDLQRNWLCCMEKINCTTLPIQYFNFIVHKAINSKNNLWTAKRRSSDSHREVFLFALFFFIF